MEVLRVLYITRSTKREVLFIPGTSYTVVKNKRRCVYLGVSRSGMFERAKIRYCDNGRYALREFEGLEKI